MTEEVTAITQIELVKDGSTYSLVFTGRNKHGDILVTSIVPGSIDRFKADHQLPKEIDEERVGCCKVVDVAAKLHEELDEAHGILASKDRVLVNLHKTINEYNETIRVERIDRAAEKEVVNRKFSEDLRKLNATIEGLKDSNIEDLKEQKRLELKLHHVKSDYGIMRTNHCNTVAKLQDDIKVLEAELSAREERIHKSQVINDNRVMVIERLKEEIDSLDAALSACKEDSVVLMKVVGMIRAWNRSPIEPRRTINDIRDIVKDCLDAPEGPPDPFIDNSCIGCERLDALNECKEQIHTQKLTIESLLKETPQVADLKQSLEAASVVLTKTENELSVCKEDSVVLTKVVEIVKNWDDSTGRAFPTLIKILDELVDYTDAPEGPPETPIDDLYRVSVFLEMP